MTIGFIKYTIINTVLNFEMIADLQRFASDDIQVCFWWKLHWVSAWLISCLWLGGSESK